MNLRNATLSDLSSIMEIEKSCFIPEIQESEQTYIDRISAFNAGCLLLEQETKVIGCFFSELWEVSKNQSIDRHFELNHSPVKTEQKNGGILYISSFAILPEHRGKHLGRFLLESALTKICKDFPQIKMIALHVNVEWQGAIKLYESVGFKTQQTSKNTFPKANNQFSDAYFMVKQSVPTIH